MASGGGDGEVKLMRSLMGGELEDQPEESSKKEEEGWNKVKVKVLSPRKPCKPDYWGTVQECRQILVMYTNPLANTVMAYDMIRHLLEKVVIDSDKARLIRRMGKGDNPETNRQILAELGTRGVREFEVYVEGIRQQGFSLLADLLEQKHFSKLINSLDPIAKRLGHHWKRMALELGTAGFIPKIENKYAKVREQALYSLLIWEETSGVAATEKRLLDALDYCSMKNTIACVWGTKKKKKGKKKGKGKKKK
ncbi:uncharacterized protein LOC121422285 isoform X1 [Lytechinus variegatus]|uniref:uncharacterized protein LOC121422285 isoform X1 n=1 Tax=Lytechinus variegatus TaxID=7654 RepID=UPI001BB21070|nr:uncharacterized protein LOC121422285 isoform X1 [Lytechinus variegatus]